MDTKSQEKESEHLIGLMMAVKERLDISQKQIDSINFIFWLTCLLEKELFTKVVSSSISEWAKLGGMKHSEEFFEYIFDELSFMGKIKIFRKGFELYSADNSGLKPFLSYAEKLNNLRNQISHHKFLELKWGELMIEDEETKISMLKEFESLAEGLNKRVK